jgi:hypothetical protein
MSRRFLVTTRWLPPGTSLSIPFEVQTTSVEEAADLAWRMMHAHYLSAASWQLFTAVRVTGRPGESGWFQLHAHIVDDPHYRTVRYGARYHVEPYEGAADPGPWEDIQRQIVAARKERT